MLSLHTSLNTTIILHVDSLVWVPWPKDNAVLHGRAPFGLIERERGRGVYVPKITVATEPEPRRKTIGNVLGTWLGRNNNNNANNNLNNNYNIIASCLTCITDSVLETHRACLTTLSHYRTRTGISTRVLRMRMRNAKCDLEDTMYGQESCALLIEKQTTN